MIFWQTSRTTKQARPAVTRAGRPRQSGLEDLEITVDTHERYPFTFADRQVSESYAAGCRPVTTGWSTTDGSGPSVERKRLGDLVSSLTNGKLRFQLTELAASSAPQWLSRSATARSSRSTRAAPRRSPTRSPSARCGGRHVPIVFCETRKLAQEWTYRFLAAARVGLAEERSAPTPSEHLKRHRRSLL